MDGAFDIFWIKSLGGTFKAHKVVIWLKNFLKYRISSYKTLPWIISAFLMLLCSENVVFSYKTGNRRLCEIIIPAGLIWGFTVCSCDSVVNNLLLKNLMIMFPNCGSLWSDTTGNFKSKISSFAFPYMVENSELIIKWILL